MNKKLIGRAVFLRHGETDYTNVFPDLTEKGKKTISNSAICIRKAHNEYSGLLSFISSPATRALGSASIIAEAMGFTGMIEEEPLLGPASLFDREKALALYQEYVQSSGMRGLCLAYGSDPRFDDGKVVESRSQVQRRFYRYLSKLVCIMLSRVSASFVVHVSHYETLYHFVETAFQLDYADQPPLGFGEVILASFYDTGAKDSLEICLAFRGKSVIVKSS